MLRINGKWARALGAFGLTVAVALVAGCGGGGGSSSATTNSSGSTSSGSTVGPSVTSAPGTFASNQTIVEVSQGLNRNAKNIPMVSVTVCIHGTSTCQTINNIQLDTGSFGLRLTSLSLSSALLSGLPAETVSGKSVAECLGFADGNTWGSVRTADVTIGGETASSIPIQILGDVPQSAAGGSNNDCASGTLNNTSAQIAANGILGIGTAKYDCGSGCATAPNGVYYGCTTSGGVTSCGDLAVPVAQQVPNPIQFFAVDNNGAILNMPAVPSSGAFAASGVLTFGIGTQANNTLPGAGFQKLTTDHYGNVQSASLSGTSLRSAFFDTGSNGLFFTDGSIAQCTGGSGFYCPGSEVMRQPSVTGFNGATTIQTVNVDNALTLFNSSNQALSTLGGEFSTLSAAFDFGMPFFYGRTVYVGYDPLNSGNQGVASSAYVALPL